MITKLNITNVKETLNESLEIKQHNLILGDWGSGKSTIIDCVQVGTQCKMMSDEFKGAGLSPICDALCTGGKDAMAIGVDGTNLSFIRTFIRKGGTFSQNIDIPEQNLSGVKACELYINAAYGKAIFDVRQLKKNPDTMKEMLLESMPIDSEKWNRKTMTENIVTAIISEFLGEGWVDNYNEMVGGDTEAMLQKAVESLQKKSVDIDLIRKHSAWASCTKDNIVVFLEGAITVMANERKARDAELKTKKKSLQGLMETESDGSIENITTLRAEIEKLQKEEAKQNELFGRAKSQLEMAEKHKRDLQQAKEEADKLKGMLSGMNDDIIEAEKNAKEVSGISNLSQNYDLGRIAICEVFLKDIIPLSDICDDCIDRLNKTMEAIKKDKASTKAGKSKEVLLAKQADMQKAYDDMHARYVALKNMTFETEALDVDTIQNLLTGYRNRRVELANRLQSAIEQKTKKEEKAQLQVVIQKLETETNLFRVTEKALQAYYNQIVSDVFTPFVSDINGGLQSDIITWKFYVELDDRYKINFGIYRKGEGNHHLKIPYRALSGAETVFARNILGAVLLKNTIQPEKILIDEIAELPMHLVPHFLTTIYQIAGDVQTFFATCHKVEAPAEWNVIKR